MVTLAGLPLAVLASSKLRELVRGPNYSDVGVPMHYGEGPAALLGVAVSVGLCVALLWLVHRFLPGSRRVVTWFGIPWLIVCNGLWLFAVCLGV